MNIVVASSGVNLADTNLCSENVSRGVGIAPLKENNVRPSASTEVASALSPNPKSLPFAMYGDQANPSLVSSTGSNMYIIHGNGGATYSNAVTLETVGQNAVLLSTGGSMTQGYGYFVRTQGNSNEIVSFSADL